MDELVHVLQQRKKELKALQQKVENSIIQGKKGIPDGRIRTIQCKGNTQYYLITKEDSVNHPNGKYVKKEDTHLLQRLAQQNYDKKILDELNKELDGIERMLKMYHPENLISIYTQMAKGRRELLTPWVQSDDEYEKQWFGTSYKGKNFESCIQEIYTEKGERVRSKSEKIIADKLYRMGIPYKYEYPLQVAGIGNIYPDFTCLHVATRKEILWEHCGMMGDEKYAKEALRKIDTYARNGFYPGKNIIYTFESAEYSLNTLVVDEIIKAYFLSEV